MQKIALCCMFLWSACSLFDREEPLPNYLTINKITYIDSVTNQPENPNTHALNTAWVYIDDELQGVYEIPARFPVLTNGVHTVKVSPGIIENGIAAIRETYPHATTFNQTVDFNGSETLLTPTTSYPGFTRFLFNEDFENPTITFKENVNSQTKITRFDKVGLKGNFCGGAVLKDTILKFEMENSVRYSIPRNSNPVFLEMNYLSDVAVKVGFFIYNPDQSLSRVVKLGINPRTEWNKIYIKLTNELLGLNSNQQFAIFVNAERAAGSDSARVYFDELKLVY